MLTSLRRHFPSRLFVLSSALFWLLMNTLAADNSFRVGTEYGRDLIWHEVWLRYLPWWGNWIILTPLTIAAIRAIDLDPRQPWQFAGKNLLLMAALMSLYWGLTVIEVLLLYSETGVTLAAIKEFVAELQRSPMHLDLLIYLAVASIGFSVTYYTRSKQETVRNARLSSQLLEVELQSLKSQLSPHFLFNTLNTISGLVRLEHKADAVNALSELSKMFRTVLENQKNQLTSLREEMAFIHSYLAIQKIRFEDKLDIDIHTDEAALDSDVPFMLLHTLVENAVQHGSQLESNHNLLKLRIAAHPEQLEIELTNQACQRAGHKGFGIGLDVSRKRLRHLYHRDDLLTCKETPDGLYVTHLTIPTGDGHA
ncbi:sensor histidine kinase [Alteromonas halophila]|uniref:Signal transduction histidine kinase internal region domain-containing protein n=1 Tax=Alteromonas halophila TaxID=516698 RepID=A0A918JGA9_9ALTE|nr:histidine kinase [Alteromonas halophila]GGW79585.1 hypothetical protein GCM10007391_10470 [Alteromonas halophila]